MDIPADVKKAVILDRPLSDFVNGRDRDRTDDLYRVKVTLVMHLIDSLSVFLPNLGRF